MKNKGISIQNILIATLIGGVCSGLLLLLLAKYSTFAFMIFANGLGVGFITSIGCYFSFREKKGWWINLILAILLTTLVHFIFYKFLPVDICNPSEVNFFKISAFIGFFGFLGGYTKLQQINLKENPHLKKSAQEEYEIAKNYRMNPVIRPLGVIVGLLFLLFPLFIFFKAMTDNRFSVNEFENLVVFLTIFSIVAVVMGIFFLSYCIPGKTPKFVLRRMEKKLKIKDRL